MQCQKCGAEIEKGEEREHYGTILCEDCYMDALSPVKACDPWAVHAAKSFAEGKHGEVPLTPIQERILAVLAETGGMEPRSLAERVGLTPAELEREIASLRHMEKVRGELRDGVRVVCLW